MKLYQRATTNHALHIFFLFNWIKVGERKKIKGAREKNVHSYAMVWVVEHFSEWFSTRFIKKVIIRFFSLSFTLSACHVIVCLWWWFSPTLINVSQQLIENNSELCRENNLRLLFCCWNISMALTFPIFFASRPCA